MTTDQNTEPEPREADNPAAWALARHIADHPVSTVQAAFRYLNAPMAIELHDDPAAVPVPPPADRAAPWLDAAAECNKAAGAYAERGHTETASAVFALMEAFLRKAGDAEYVATPCDFVACEPGGEPCSVHERLMGHAEGDHELCAPDCGAEWLRRVAAEEQPAETQADRGAVLLEIATTLDGLAETDMICKRRSLGTARRLLAGELRKMAAEPSTARPAVGDQPETQEEQHLGGRANAEDCPACKAERRNLPYPFLCPGPDVP